MSRARALAAFLFVLVACVGCDHAAKYAAVALLANQPPIALAGDTVRFQLVENPGAFLSLGASLPEPLRSALLSGFVPLLLLCFCAWFVRPARASAGELVALGLVVGGGLGNWLDRLQHGGAVTDFVSIGLGPVHTGIFNVADAAIMAGLAIVLWKSRGSPASRA